MFECARRSRSGTRLVADGDRAQVELADEALVDGMAGERDQRPPVAGDVEQPDRLGVQAELRPRQLLHQLVERPEATRESHERTGELRHQRLALVQRLHDPKLGQSLVGELALDELLRNDAHDLAAAGERRVRELAHQADAPAAVDEPEAARAISAERPRRVEIGRAAPARGAAEHTDPLHPVTLDDGRRQPRCCSTVPGCSERDGLSRPPKSGRSALPTSGCGARTCAASSGSFTRTRSA